MKYVYLTFFLLCTAFSGMAQDDCDCPIDPNEVPVCVLDSLSGEVFPLPNVCFADCLGLPVIDGDCDFGGNGGGTDCVCPDIYDPVCAVNSTGVIIELPNACYAECLGLDIVDGADCDVGGGGDDCDCEISDGDEVVCILTDPVTGLVCPFPNLCFAECAGYSADQAVDCENADIFCVECINVPYDPVCVVDSAGYVFQVPNACFADCLGFGLAGDGVDCNGGFPGGDCDCDVDPNEPPVCVLDTLTGDIYPFPNACLAACYGLSIVDGGDCDYTNGEDCFCPDVYDPVCVVDSTGVVFQVSNACWASCFDLEIVDDADCDLGGGGNDCDCPDVYDPVCAVDANGVIIEVPNACIAECLDLAIVDNADCDYTGGGDDCDCEISDDDEIVCILTDPVTGVICPFPNLCLAECAGYSADQQVDCADTGIFCLECLDAEFDPVCVIDSGYVFQVPNLCFAECLGLELAGDDVDCDDGPPVDDCDCDFDPNEPPVCVIDSTTGDVFSFPNACLAECYGLEIVDDADCDYQGGGGDCACPDIYDPVCAVDSTGVIIEVPNACYAECFGLEIVDDEDCDYTDGDDCGCEISDDDEVVCILTDPVTGVICPFPNMCLAECAGYSADQQVDCENSDIFCLECLDAEFDPVCVIDSGYVFQVPNLCFAECLGLELAGDDVDCDDGTPNDCGCDIGDDDEYVCVVDSTGVVFELPNACFADCFGLEVVDCEGDDDDDGDADGGQDADGSIGGTNTSNEADASPGDPTGDRSIIRLALHPNPVQDDLYLNIQVDEASHATIDVLDLSGNRISTKQLNLDAGENAVRMNVSAIHPGMYLVNVRTNRSSILQRFMK